MRLRLKGGGLQARDTTKDEQRLWPDLDEKCGTRENGGAWEKGPRTLNFYVISSALEKFEFGSDRAEDIKLTCCHTC